MILLRPLSTYLLGLLFSPVFYDYDSTSNRNLNKIQVLQSRVPLKGLRIGVSGAGQGETLSKVGLSLFLLVQVFYVLFYLYYIHNKCLDSFALYL